MNKEIKGLFSRGIELQGTAKTVQKDLKRKLRVA